jgi:hypothetical protein
MVLVLAEHRLMLAQQTLATQPSPGGAKVEAVIHRGSPMATLAWKHAAELAVMKDMLLDHGIELPKSPNLMRFAAAHGLHQVWTCPACSISLSDFWDVKLQNAVVVVCSGRLSQLPLDTAVHSLKAQLSRIDAIFEPSAIFSVGKKPLLRLLCSFPHKMLTQMVQYLANLR